jgi:hypothetical protein
MPFGLLKTMGLAGVMAHVLFAAPGRAEAEVDDVPAAVSPSATEPSTATATDPADSEDPFAAVDEPALPAGGARGVRVRVKLDVTGELLAPAGPDAAPVREPVELAARFDFEETSSIPSAPEAATVVRRAYRDATASMRFGDATTTATLAADARQVCVVRQGTTPMPYLDDGFLSGEESDLLETPFDSLLIDDLMPRKTTSIGEVWEIPADITAGLLAIDTVESGVIEARIQGVAEDRATVTFAGIIDGAVDGVPTHVTVEGSFAAAATSVAAAAVATDPDVDTGSDSEPARYDLHGRVAQLSAVIRERRQASHVAPGFEVEARLLVARTPRSPDVGLVANGEMESERQADQVADVADVASRAGSGQDRPPRRRGEGGPGRVWYRDAQGRFDLVHDVRWRRVEDGPNGLVMRLVDRGALVGQCSMTSLPRAPATSLPTREEVQRDVERSLAGQVVRIDSAEETDRADGLKVVRLASSGTAGRLPFRWVHYVLAAQDGSRVSVTFMFEESMQQRFGDVDRQLIEGLRLPAARPHPDSVEPPGPTAAVPAGDRQTPR